MDIKLEDLHHSIDIKDEDGPNFDYQQDSNEESQRNSNNYSEIKTEEEWELQLEELHHSIDIKEEAPIQECRPEGERNTDEKLDEALDDLPAYSYDHKMEVMNAELEELHHSIDIKEEDDATLEFQEDSNEGTLWRSNNHSQIKSEEIELKLEDLYHHSINNQEDCSVHRRKTKASTKPHMREISKCNSGKKAFKCEICDYRSAQKGTLTRHLKTHTGEKEFKCEIYLHLKLLALLRKRKNAEETDNLDMDVQEKLKVENKIIVNPNHNKSPTTIDVFDFQDEDIDDVDMDIDVPPKKKIFSNTNHRNWETSGNSDEIMTDEENDPPYKQPISGEVNYDTDDSDDHQMEPSAKNKIDKTKIINLVNKPTPTLENETMKAEIIIRKTGSKNKILCKYCRMEVTNFERHLERNHSDELEVLELTQLSKKSLEDRKERKRILTLIRNQANFDRFIAEKSNSEDMLPCSHCKRLLSKNYLRRHFKNCIVKPVNDSGKLYGHISKSQTLIACAADRSNTVAKMRVKNEVFSIMAGDKIAMVAKTDFLIVQYGENYLKEHKRQQIINCCSNKMREFARLLIEMRKIVGNDNFRLVDVLDPTLFEIVVAAAKILGGYDEDKKTYKSPSTPIHIGTSLKQICDICTRLLLEKHREFTKIDVELKLKQVKRFKFLIEGQWITEISSLALKNLAENKWNKPTLLPLTEDIKKFRDYINQTAAINYSKLKDNANDASAFKALAEASLVSTILYNRHRIGDVQYTSIQSYQANQSSNNLDECLDSLTESEKLLTKEYKRVVAGGKGSRQIVILFPTNIQEYINLLLEIRLKTRIVPDSNQYLFAYPNVKNSWIRADAVIRKMAKCSKISNPDLMTSNRLRKQIATIMQLLNLSKSESKQFSKFMGHTEKIQEEFYEITQDVYRTAKISKVLNLMDKGHTKDIDGKNFEDIDVTNAVVEDELETTEQPGPSSSKSEDAASEENEVNLKKKQNRVRWTSKQKKLVEDHFKKNIKYKVAPKKQECNELKNKYGELLGNLDWVKIKTYVYNMYKNN